TKSASLGAITEKGNGLYEVTLTTGTRSSLAVITASLDDVRLPLASVKQIADEASASLNKGDLTLLNTGPVTANGTSQAQASARVLDTNNNPVAGVDVTFSLSGSAKPVGGALVVKTDSKGIALLKFTNTVAEKVKVTGKVGSGTPQSVEATFIADRSSASLNKGELKLVNTAPVAANGTSQAQASARVLDGKNNPVSGVDVTFTLNGSARPEGGRLVIKTDSKGIALLKFTNTVAEKVTVTGKVGNGTPQSVEATFIADSASASLKQGEMKLVNTAPVAANGRSQAQASARVLDGKNNPVSGVDVTFTLGGSAKPEGGRQVIKTDSKGIALLKFTNTVTEKVKVTGKVGNGTSQSVEATFKADESTANIVGSNIKTNVTKITADSASSVLYTVTVKDALGHPVPNMALVWSDVPDGATLTGQTKTNSEGKATVKMHTRKGGDAVLKVSVNGKSKVSAPKIIMEQSRASYSHQMTAAKLNAILLKSHDVLIRFTYPTKGSGTAVFTFPAASASNKGARIEIWSHGYGGVHVYINGLMLKQQYEAAMYISNGVKWTRTR
ncbi:Ig-like domain-containing protein, partial [Candidatus Pantoea multigeneris]